MVKYFNFLSVRSFAIFLFCVQFIDQFGNRGLTFGVCIVLVDTLLVGLLDRDNRVSAQVLKFCQDFLCHLPYAVFHKPRIFVRGEHNVTFVPTLEELVDAAAHGYLEDADDL